jgi:hypothetical protein
MLDVLRRLRARHPEDVYVFGGAEPLGDFRKRWYAACCKAGQGKSVCASCENDTFTDNGACTRCGQSTWKYKGLVFHDLRRSAVRNLVRAGVDEGVAMKISGHKTRDVFERYNITSTEYLHNAVRLRDAYVKTVSKERTAEVVETTTDDSNAQKTQ